MHVTQRDGQALTRPNAAGALGQSAEPTLELKEHPALRELLGGTLLHAIGSAFERIEWAEQEIEAAMREHPEHADRIWHSFRMLEPTHDLMRTEMVYRAHSREILTRVAAGEDTRPGTAAECCCACCETSQLAPLHDAGIGLYMRMWQAAGFPEIDDLGVRYEALNGAAIDRHERTLRGKLRREDRRLPDVLEHVARCPWTLAHADGA